MVIDWGVVAVLVAFMFGVVIGVVVMIGSRQ